MLIKYTELSLQSFTIHQYLILTLFHLYSLLFTSRTRNISLQSILIVQSHLSVHQIFIYCVPSAPLKSLDFARNIFINFSLKTTL